MKNHQATKLCSLTITALLAITPVQSAIAQLINPFTGQPMPQPTPTSPGLLLPTPTPAKNPSAESKDTNRSAPPTGTLPAPAAANTSAPALAAQTSATTDNSAAVLSNTPNPGVTLKFDNADIYDVLQVILGEILKLDYIIDPSIQGRITLRSTGAISMADIFNTLETALSTSNISIVRQGKVYKVVRDANAPRDSVSQQGTGPASTVMQIIPVKFVQANQLVNTLRNFVGPQAAITNDPANKHLVVVDRAANVDKIIDMVKTLDVDYFSQINIRLIPLTHGEAAEMAKELEGLFKTSGLFNWTGTDPTKAYFLPVTRMNALLVATSNERVMQAAEQWIKTLDAAPQNGLGSFVHVYPVVHSNAVHLANLITQIFGGAAGSTTNAGASSLPSANTSSFAGTGTTPPSGGALGSTGAASGTQTSAAATRTIERGSLPSQQASAGTGKGLGGSVQVIADEVTNTLIVRASAADFQQVRKVLERLDTSPRQVLVQVVVAEVTLNDTLQYGVEWWLKSALSIDGKKWPGYLGLEGNIAPQITTSGTTASTLVTPTVKGVGTGLNYAVFGSAGQVIGMLNLLGQDTDVNVLSTPHVMASDGKIARVEIGNEVPVITQTVSTPTSITTGSTFSTSNSVQYRPTGILLEVKPSITSAGRVSLSISQEVSSVGNAVAAGGSEYPSFQKRKVTTDATIEDGKTIMLAGLIEDRGNDTVTGVPGLKDVPVFGTLFGTTKKTRNKTELLITITPYIVNNREEGDRVADLFQGSLKQLRGLLDKNSTPDLSAKAALAKPPQPESKPAVTNGEVPQN
jgi:general secretion pathway protein D